ncbi:MAG: cytochrome c-type biogenesis protein [Candidatus Binataceae bacterium]
MRIGNSIGAVVRVAIVTIAIAALYTPVRAAAAIHPKTTEQSVTEGLTCQCGCGLTVANCNHPNCIFSVPLRTKIDGMIAKGMDRVQIIAFFRHQYGEKILSSPTTQGFNIFAWIIPPLAIIAGCAAVLFTVTRWRGASSSAPIPETPGPAPSAALSSFDPELRKRLEREIKDRV